MSSQDISQTLDTHIPVAQTKQTLGATVLNSAEDRGTKLANMGDFLGNSADTGNQISPDLSRMEDEIIADSLYISDSK